MANGPMANKMNNDVQVDTLLCGWRDCNQYCEDLNNINSHIAIHLETTADCNTPHLENNDDDKSIVKMDVNNSGEGVSINMCLWEDCEFSCSCPEEFKRHSYYHGYYASLLLRGNLECAANPKIPRCHATPRVGHIIPELLQNFKCFWTNCCQEFISIVEFQDHIVQHATFDYSIQKTHTDQYPKTACRWDNCQKQLPNKYRLIEHIRTHTNKQLLACTHCGMTFRTRTTLFDHLRRQPYNPKTFQCEHCFKYYATEKMLRSHLLGHINLHKCSMCEMTCSTSAALVIHVRYRHLKDKPFKCKQCDMRCVRARDLAEHVQLVHTKSLLHCNVPHCKYAARSYPSLRRHYIEVHRDSPIFYACHCCERYFKSGKTLSVHLIKKHGYRLPSGHKRFHYRMDENGFYRITQTRYECLEVTDDSRNQEQAANSNVSVSASSTDESSAVGKCYEIVNPTSEHGRVIVSTDASEAELVGELHISLPTLMAAIEQQQLQKG